MNIAVKVISFIVTALLNAVIAVFMFGALIIGMNGFPSSKSAEPGIILYIAWVIISTVIMSTASVLIVWFLADKKDVNVWLAGLISVVIFSVLGGISIIIGWAAGLLFASLLYSM